MKKIKKILIVEDSKLFNNHLKRALSDIVEEIVQLYTFHEAEILLEEEEFDYIFLDLILPDGEGDELVESLSAKVRNKTIVLTADEDVERRDYLFKLGILEYFSKLNPINLIVSDIKHLLETLEENKNYNILIVDDSSFIRKTLKNILRPRKYNLLFAKDAKEAEEILNKNKIHLMFLDIELPDKSGVEFLEEVKSKKEFLDLPVIAISNNDNPVIVARLLKHGAKDFIKKPFIAEYLVLKCNLHLQNYKNILLLKEKNEEIRKLNKLKSQFFSSVSHEIRTPLNAIDGFIKMLLKMELNEEAKKYVKILNSTVEDLLKIINDLLDFEKSENKKLEIEKVKFNLRDILDEIKEIYTQKAKEKNLIFKSEFENVDKNIISDPLRIKQIINNLLSNAFKFTPENKKIFLKVKLKDENLEIVVEDEGIGIEKDKISKILEPFTQASEDTARKYGGTGLGMSIVKRLVELLNGSMEIESEINKGTKFSINIPVKIEKNKKLNILAAEDDEFNRILLETMFKHLGYNFKIVENGEEALKEFKKHKYDVILLDREMPVMNGDEVLREIKKISSNTKVISISGSQTEGYDFALEKPFTMDKLKIALEEVV